MNEETYYQSFDLVRLDLYHTSSNSSTFGDSIQIDFKKANELFMTVPNGQTLGERNIEINCKCCGAPLILKVKYGEIAILSPEQVVQLYNDKSGIGYKIIHNEIIDAPRSSLMIFSASALVLVIIFFFVNQEPFGLWKILAPIGVLVFGLMSSYLEYLKVRKKLGVSKAWIAIRNEAQSKYLNSISGIKTKTIISSVQLVVDGFLKEETGFVNEKVKEINHYLTDIKSAIKLREEINQLKSFKIFSGPIKYQSTSGWGTFFCD